MAPQPPKSVVSKVKGIQIGPTKREPGSMLKKQGKKDDKK